MPHWRSFTDRETLGVWDLWDKEGNAVDRTSEIVRVDQGVVKSKDKPSGDRRPFVYLAGAKKPLICNATNAKTISSMAGSEDTNKWIGLRVTLYQTNVKAAGGAMVPAIRIRPQRSNRPPEKIEERDPDEATRNVQKAGAGEPVEDDRGGDPDDH